MFRRCGLFLSILHACILLSYIGILNPLLLHDFSLLRWTMFVCECVCVRECERECVSVTVRFSLSFVVLFCSTFV